MKKLLLLFFGAIAISGIRAEDTLYVKEPQIPILIERQDNVLFYMRLDAKETRTLNNMEIAFDKKRTSLRN